ncbi:preprotein translocase subunit SecY [Entomospira culicis]|uniref:Protein translocase subunit SecY n=1 Tax=Entomospira culicis TaxID=2719989 RepID=A0A968GGZ9_9SPIO|nr:preprotein translocase subunit SecY [Entomospira culicis]NIZ19699.1 preprotein translocase subunit SecY [Entomospira culicis]NIZ69913.1 preprotein translocase subunit SecY [Entomospira culicis]WDI37018.1 preprotein translocase subunit SecY [Entomospira culicis]WDI38647.1 preprotein translocase subunit SecY [Entomospira culicis]
MAKSSIVDIFKVRELRSRILYTLILLLIFRIGTVIPIPGINVAVIQERIAASRAAASGGGMGFSDFLDFFSGGAFSNFSVLMLGIMPYISAQIILQIALLVFPTFKRAVEEDGGKRKFQKYTRWLTILVSFVQGAVTAQGAFAIEGAIVPQLSSAGFFVIAMVSITAGTMFLVWLGEQITQKGVGNGISLIIFVGIVAQMPGAVWELISGVRSGNINVIAALVSMLMFVGIIVFVIFEQQGERRIPVNYAKRIVGRQMVQAQNTYIPFKLNPSGVIPIIFASSILTFFIQILQPLAIGNDTMASALNALRINGPLYNTLYAIFIMFFAYFYTQVSLNPIEVARQIREHGGSIPGVRSEQMERYLKDVLNYIIVPGALFLVVIALLPTLLNNWMGLPDSVAHLMGGTSLLILVGVDLDLMNQIESHLRMHRHDGLTVKGRIQSRNL